MRKVLFVCTGNTCRSPMAEAVFNAMCKEKNIPMCSESAGICTRTGIPASENSVRAMADMGIDISDFTSTLITDKDTDAFDIFAVMTDEHKEVLVSFGIDKNRIYVLSEKNGGVSDPYGGSEARYLICRDEIIDAVGELLEYMEAEYESC